jgi:glycosyltransferase involved in cell wall biosynthesis
MDSASLPAKPILALVSIGVRRDLIAPLVYFTKFNLVHFYQKSVYGDLSPEDMDSTLHAYSSPIQLYRGLVAAHPDAIQSVEPFSFYTQPFLWACVMAARKTSAPLVVPTHENRPLDIKFGKTRATMLRRLLNIVFARACLIITHNNGGRSSVLECGAAPEKIVRGMWGNWGVDTREFFPRTSRPPDLPPTVLFVGRLHREKGVFVLLDALVRVQQLIPDAKLVYIGDGPAHDELNARIQAYGLADAVTLAGTIKHRDVPAALARADVFCAPSITTQKLAEQVGSSSLQAMAAGVPVVSTRSGAIPEYVPDGVAGILVQENHPEALANALSELLADPARTQEMGRRAREYACAYYDARTNVERGEQLVMEHCLARRI